VSIAEIKANGYNLDIKNPHDAGAGNADPDALLAEYQTLLAKIAATRDQLKDELRAALEGKPA
jgi:type I restriction enzyme M protein